jgi:hypothetical protein
MTTGQSDEYASNIKTMACCCEIFFTLDFPLYVQDTLLSMKVTYISLIVKSLRSGKTCPGDAEFHSVSTT